MMFRQSNDVMLAGYSRMDSNTLASVMHFDLAGTIAHPNRLPRISPRHRVSIAFPGTEGIPCHFAQFFFDVSIGRPSSDGMKLCFLFRPSSIDVFVRGSVHPLIGNFPRPTPQLGIQLCQVRWFTTLKTAQKVSADVLHARFNLPLRLSSIGSTQSRTKAPVLSEIPKHGMPHDLATFIGHQPHRLHAVVEKLFRHTAQLSECFFMHPQQRSQLLVQCRFDEHRAAVSQRESKSPQLAFDPIHIDRAEMSPIDLGLSSGWRFESTYGCYLRRLSLRSQPVGENRVAARVTAFAQLAHDHARIPHAGFQSLTDVGLEGIQFARACLSWSVNRCRFRLDQILPDRLSIVAREFAY